uniref:Uncharacterized protein n=1 Tax=Ananas comosus var. bracteatus TaxID=296719 RepID=A0A6V7NEW4_ANACO|nr:unnamed protein product [Ananas comosus var. bracteatus]
MASSLNGLSVGDTLSENLMESPARSDSLSYPRDEIAFQYSPMSEDSDDCRYCDTPLNPSTTQTDPASSPSSPRRLGRPLPFLAERHVPRGGPQEGRASEVGADENAATLPAAVRTAVQLGQESIDSFEEGDDRPDQCVKSQDDEAGYHSPEHEADYIEDCSSADGTLESKFSQD